VGGRGARVRCGCAGLSFSGQIGTSREWRAGVGVLGDGVGDRWIGFLGRWGLGGRGGVNMNKIEFRGVSRRYRVGQWGVLEFFFLCFPAGKSGDCRYSFSFFVVPRLHGGRVFFWVSAFSFEDVYDRD